MQKKNYDAIQYSQYSTFPNLEVERFIRLYYSFIGLTRNECGNIHDGVEESEGEPSILSIRIPPDANSEHRYAHADEVK